MRLLFRHIRHNGSDYGANFVIDDPATILITRHVDDNDRRVAAQRGCKLYEMPRDMWAQLYADLQVHDMNLNAINAGIPLPPEQVSSIVAAILKGEIV